MQIEFTNEELMQMKTIDELMSIVQDTPGEIVPAGPFITRRRY
ncbi:ryptide family R-Y-crosslinked RiPP peptide [Streptococcus suis]